MDISSFKGVNLTSGQPMVTGAGRSGSLDIQVGNKLHMKPSIPPVENENVAGSFADALNTALGNVEKLDQKSSQLTQQAIYDPDSVEAHTVILAAEKSRFALNLTKNIADGVVRAFRDVTNPR